MTGLITSRLEISEELFSFDRSQYDPELGFQIAANTICRDIIFSDVDETLDAIRTTDDAEVVGLSVLIHALQAPDGGVLRLYDALRIILAHERGLAYAYTLADETRTEYGIPLAVAAFVRMVSHRFPYGFRVEHPFSPYDTSDDEDLIEVMTQHDLPGLAAFLKVDRTSIYWFEDLGAAMMGKLKLGAHDRG